MLSFLNRVVARLAACLAAGALCVGCSGGLNCGNGCATKSPYAFTKYEACCETCGPGGGFGCCNKCGQKSCTCGDNVTCGNGCSSGQGQCGDGCGGGCKAGWFKRTFCGCAGCGERYWNEWCNDPPSQCDPCDGCGNWTGCGGCGCYQAPYLRREGCCVTHASSPPPLEYAEPTADEAPDQATTDETIAHPAMAKAEKIIDHAAATAYDDSDLDTRLQ